MDSYDEQYVRNLEETLAMAQELIQNYEQDYANMKADRDRLQERLERYEGPSYSDEGFDHRPSFSVSLLGKNDMVRKKKQRIKDVSIDFTPFRGFSIGIEREDVD